MRDISTHLQAGLFLHFQETETSARQARIGSHTQQWELRFNQPVSHHHSLTHLVSKIKNRTLSDLKKKFTLTPGYLNPALNNSALEVQKCSFKHFPWHFSSEKSILGQNQDEAFASSCLMLSTALIWLNIIDQAKWTD